MHRLYVNDDITVFWDSDKCRHAKKCVTGCPKVFDIQRKPWIDISRDENAKIWKAVSECPSGALGITYNHGIKVVFEEENNRSAAYDGERCIGECNYQEVDGAWVADHTEVDPEYKGKKIAKRLVFCVLEAAERRKINVIPACPFVKKTV